MAEPKKPAATTLSEMLAEVFGWYGAIAILFAYGLVTFQYIAVDGAVYQLLNLTGSMGIMAIAAYKKVWQSVALNIFWGGIAIVALLRLMIG